MRRKALVALALVLVLAVAVFIGLWELFSPVYTPRQEIARRPRDVVGLITIDGVIAAGEGGLFSSGKGDLLQEELRQAGKDPIKALVVRINSPGGSAASSQEIYREIKRVRESGKVVVVSMADIATSGGYMIACAADYIVANPATLTGSIGVIIDATNVKGLYDLLGIEYEVIKSGEFKDSLNPAKPLTEEEKALFQEMIDDIFEQFVQVVMEGRGLSREEVLSVADGRILTGKQALEAGLVDQLGNLYDAIEIAAEMAGIEGEPQLYRYSRRGLLGWFSRGGSQIDIKGLLSFPERIFF